MHSSTYRDLKVSVWTTPRSAAQIVCAWLARKVRQVWLGGRSGLRHRERRIERLLTATPSLRSSPRMRSAPHSGLSRDIRVISSRTSVLSRGPAAAAT